MKDIEQAYRRYAASIHPDKFFDDPPARKEAETKLRELNCIMQTLRDPMKRAVYDASL
jgi:DnaJ-class molecular chaperone